ncbi:hypothetical protein LAZ67_12001876 [Cordylochernes scorpioides]|uniref:Mitochondrial protein n=1 Tax=Cordylochernes scorpioides TaxID=51811 RepID=A0ABY6L1D6_9ARAC|nr:hypothetical protein LAZ67_12001876 [Cordylochernes scorpioides]
MYITNCTSSDISSAIGILSRRVVKPNEHDWKALKRILGYLKSTLDLVLVFKTSYSVELTGYIDADWGNEKDRKSTTGYIYKLGTNLITWVNQNENSVSPLFDRSRIFGSSNRRSRSNLVRLVDFHFINDLITNNFLSLNYCPTEKMLADILTKPLAKNKFQELRQGIELITYSH